MARKKKNVWDLIFENEGPAHDYRDTDDDNDSNWVETYSNVVSYEYPEPVDGGGCPFCGGIGSMKFDGSFDYVCDACGETLVDSMYHNWRNGLYSTEEIRKWKRENG